MTPLAPLLALLVLLLSTAAGADMPTPLTPGAASESAVEAPAAPRAAAPPSSSAAETSLSEALPLRPALPARARRFMVAAAHPLAAAAGEEILQAGGSAVDAAIAVQMVLTLVEPQSSGIGGGAFLLHYEAETGKVSAFDGRETAPQAARPDRFLAAGRPLPFLAAVTGGISVGVPGVVAMLHEAHRDFGRLPWAMLFAPAIRLSEQGFAVSPRLHAMIARDPILAKRPATRRYFFLPDGRPLPIGHLLRNPELAATLRRIAAEGPAAFYRGPIARDILRAVREARPHPGDMTAEDLAAYRPKRRAPICGLYRIWTVCGMPPPSSGGIAVLQILGLLRPFEMGRLAPGSAESAHLLVEAERLAFADRNTYVGDPDRVQVPTAALTDPAYLAGRSRLIARDRALPAAPPGDLAAAPRPLPGQALEIPATSHVSIVDGRGNAVAMTTSIEAPFGSHIMTRGFLLNNQLTDFAFRPEGAQGLVANAPGPGKRPMSSMSPTLVFDQEGALRLVIGSPGGPRIIGYVAQTLIAFLDWGLDVQAAIDLPRILSTGEAVELEKDTPAEALAPMLAAMGHRVEIDDLTSGLHGIAVTAAGLEGGADPRREGVALGE